MPVPLDPEAGQVGRHQHPFRTQRLKFQEVYLGRIFINLERNFHNTQKVPTRSEYANISISDVSILTSH